MSDPIPPSAVDPTRPVTPDKLPGGRYNYSANGDGTYNVLDVPIIAEIPAGAFPHPVNAVPIDAKWHAAALAKSRAREKDGHLGAVHMHHHDTAEVQSCGLLQLAHVGEIEYEGKKQSALFANLLRVPKQIIDMIGKGGLPYRSIEGAKWEDEEITSLALMPTKTPYFRLPMLLLGKEVTGMTSPFSLSTFRDQPAVACSMSGTSFSVLTDFSGIDKMAEQKAEAAAPVAAAVPNPTPMPPFAGQNPQGVNPAQPPQAPPAPAAPSGVLAKMKLLLRALTDIVLEFAGADGGSEEAKAELPNDAENAGKEREKNKAPTEQKPPPQAAAPAAVAASAPVSAQPPAEDPAKALLLQLAAKDGEIAALRTQVAAHQAQLNVKAQADQRAQLVDGLIEKHLAGYNLAPDFRETMLRLSANGPEVVEACVVQYRVGAVKDPPARIEAATVAPVAATASAPSATQDEGDQVLNSLGPVGPEVMARARELIAQGRSYCAVVKDTKLSDYVRRNLAADKFIKA